MVPKKYRNKGRDASDCEEDANNMLAGYRGAPAPEGHVYVSKEGAGVSESREERCLKSGVCPFSPLLAQKVSLYRNVF